jgi:hypothetical protein
LEAHHEHVAIRNGFGVLGSTSSIGDKLDHSGDNNEKCTKISWNILSNAFLYKAEELSEILFLLGMKNCSLNININIW